MVENIENVYFKNGFMCVVFADTESYYNAQKILRNANNLHLKFIHATNGCFVRLEDDKKYVLQQSMAGKETMQELTDYKKANENFELLIACKNIDAEFVNSSVVGDNKVTISGYSIEP